MARKAKSYQGALKRVRLSASGKLLRQKPFSNHFLSKKRGSRKRTFAQLQQLNGSVARNIKRIRKV